MIDLCIFYAYILMCPVFVVSRAAGGEAGEHAGSEGVSSAELRKLFADLH